jgi:hypothetical protein
MKLIIKMMIAILVIGILLPFTILKGKDGAPLLKFNDLKLPDSDVSLTDIAKLPDDIHGSEDGNLIYQWIDAEGNLQFSNKLPPQGVDYSIMDYDPNLNVIQAVEVPVKESIQETENEVEKKTISAEGIGNPYSPEKIEKLFDDANNIEKLLNQRLQNQEALIGQ